MGALRTLGSVTARGVASLAMAYVLIVKLVIGAAATTVVLPVAGLDPVICLNDHTTTAQGDSTPAGAASHRCDDCSLHRLAADLLPPPDAVLAGLVSPDLRQADSTWPSSMRPASPPGEAWGPTRAQRGPPARA